MVLKNKVAIVTGGTRGIGEAIVRKFVKEGCRVAFTFVKNRKKAGVIKKETATRSKGYELDVRDMKKTREFFDNVKKDFKHIDILVNNAGIFKDKPLLMMDKSDWDDVIDTNLTGTFNMTRSCIFTFMKQKGGSIINVSSLSGVLGIPGQTNYCASKAGLIGFTKALARETGSCNVRVNAIAPGYIKTKTAEKAVKKNVIERILAQTPLQRFGTTDEIAEIAVFLASNKSGYITGQTIIADAGLSA